MVSFGHIGQQVGGEQASECNLGRATRRQFGRSAFGRRKAGWTIERVGATSLGRDRPLISSRLRATLNPQTTLNLRASFDLRAIRDRIRRAEL